MSQIDFWPECGYLHLAHGPQGWLQPTDAYWRHWLQRPELALVSESCAAERRLHTKLQEQPTRSVPVAQLQAFADGDARSNYAVYLRFRDAVLAAGTLEAFYLRRFSPQHAGLADSDVASTPPLFLDAVVQTIARHVLEHGATAFEARAGELLFRPQRITLEQGRVLAADEATVQRLSADGGLGALGRLLKEADAPMRQAQLAVLRADNAGDNLAEYWHDAGRHRFVLDLTQSLNKNLTQGVTATLAWADSGLSALAKVLERWVAHLLRAQVRITPLAKIEDPQWRWHVGLDAQSTAILNALYRGEAVGEELLQRLLGLFRLDFTEPTLMPPDLAGKPVYLGLAMAADHTLRLKPQNLAVSLPVGARG